MKSRLNCTPFIKQLRCGCDRIFSDCVARKNDFVAAKGCVRRQHQVLLGVGIFFLLCWIIASIWLINKQRQEPGYEVISEHQEIISMHFPAKMLINREVGPNVFASIDVFVAGGI